MVSTETKPIFLRGKPICLTSTTNTKNTLKKVYKTSISKVKEQIRRSIYNAFSTRKGRIAKRNLLKRSYFYRFILKKHRTVCKRTLGLEVDQPFNYLEERDAYNLFLEKVKKGRKRRLKSKKPFQFGIVYIAHRRRNTFITIYKKFLDGTNQMMFKASVGLTGYVGPKRSTHHGKERVAKFASSFLRKQKYTSVDLVFTKGIGRWFSFTIRGLFAFPIELRHIYIAKRRGHGLARRKKVRRT